MTTTTTLEGRFERVIWQARDSGDFKVCTFRLPPEDATSEGREVVVKGNIPARLQHCDVCIRVSTVHSERFGQQYRYESLETHTLPKSRVGFVKYMGQNHGLSANAARALYEHLGGHHPYTHLDRLVADLAKETGTTGSPYDALQALAKQPQFGRLFKRVAAPLLIPKYLGVQKAFALLLSWAKLKQGNHMEAWLHTLGFTGSDIERIVAHQPTLTLGALKANLYVLCGQLGFAFHIVDSMVATHLSKGGALALTEPRRVQAALIHGIQHSCFLDGHVCLPLNALCGQAFKLLRQCRHVAESVTDDALSQAIIDAVHTLRKSQVSLRALYDPLHVDHANPVADVRTPQLIIKQVRGTTYAYHPCVWHYEKRMARTLHGVQHDRYARFHVEPDTIAHQCQRDHGFAPDASQVQALAMLCTQSFILLRGGAGTGKTTLMHTLISLCSHANVQCILAAPTGVAAKRMEERTGQEAYTIHSLVAQWMRRVPRGNHVVAFILDEMSMVDMGIFVAFLEALQQARNEGLHAKLVLVGDPQQLPPVGPGHVFVALLDAETVPTCTLQVVHRQKKGQLIETATRIIHADTRVAALPAPTPPFPYLKACLPAARHTAELTRFGTRQAADTLMQLLSGGLIRVGQPRDFARVQILCAIKQGTLGKNILNQRIQAIFNPPNAQQPSLSNEATRPELLWQFRMGDKVMYTHNDYALGTRNGQQGFITALDPKAQTVTVDFACATGDKATTCLTIPKAKWQAHLEPSYAMTIHKSQGSEYDTTFIMLPQGKSAVMQCFLDRRLFYTALTRTKRKCYLFADDDMLNETLQNTATVSRYTLFADVMRSLHKKG